MRIYTGKTFPLSGKMKYQRASRYHGPLTDLYENRLKPSDDKETYGILDTIVSDNKNDNERALLFYLLNETVTFSDGALSEMLGYSFIFSNPAYVFEYFLTHKSLMIEYALHCGYKFSLDNRCTDEPHISYDMLMKKVKDGIAGQKYNNLINEFDRMLIQTIKDSVN